MDGMLVRGVGATAALGLVCVLSSGCVRLTDGTAGLAAAAKPVVLADALLDPSRFPAAYPAAVLDEQGTAEAVTGVAGVPAGATVKPPDCAPPPTGSGPRDAVAAQGVDPATGAALTVILTRTYDALSVRREELERCPSFTATAGEVVTTVDTVLLPPPPADADDTLAAESTIRRADGPPVRTLVLTAQLDEVRLTAAWRNDDPGFEPDSAALDHVFGEALSAMRGAR